MKRFSILLIWICSISSIQQACAQNDATSAAPRDDSPLSLRYASPRSTYNPASKHSFPSMVRRLLQSNLQWNGKNTGLETLISVHCSPDGKLLSAAIFRSSGDLAWDSAVMRAIKRSDPMPADDDGRTPENFKITFRQTDSSRPTNGQPGSQNCSLNANC
ncbi:energy transducer TonB [Paraburkholderia bannensis]|uniref:energy transducer TonB n=1 Tax=Paraburkholderia bannensis TaxID=765414 RepID=UPI002ABE7D65|nr:energy transducer TonB [Paraburkholderia bannensis]